jgi:hypothetical protein
MIFIKFLLILILTIAFIIFAFSYKLRIFQKLSVISGYLLVFFFILYPQYSDTIAHLFSIKSGTDLIIYIVVALSVLVNIVLYVGQNNTNRIITKIVRENAKEHAKKC